MKDVKASAIGKPVALVLFCGLWFFCAAGAAGREQQPSVDSLIETARRAMGRAALDSVKTLAISATTSLNFGGTIPTTTRAVEISYVAPGRYLQVGRQHPHWPTEMELTYYDGFDGPSPIRDVVPSLPQLALPVSGSRGSEDVGSYRARRLHEARDEFVQAALPLLISLPADFGLTFETGGNVAHAGGRADVLVVSRPGTRRWTLLIDAKTGLPVQLSWKGRPVAALTIPSTITRAPAEGAVPTNAFAIILPVDAPLQAADVDWIMTIRDYRQADGLNWPRRFVTRVDGRPYLDVRVSKYRLNPPIDPAIFQHRFR